VADIEEDAARRVAEEIGGTFVAADVTREADVDSSPGRSLLCPTCGL
jgi:hypothetical protein